MATTWNISVTVMDENTDMNVAATSRSHRTSLAGNEIGDFDREELRKICNEAAAKIAHHIERKYK